MQANSGSASLRYFALLRLTLAAALLRLVPWIPFFLVYFLPLGTWSKLLIVFSPVLWYTVVGPVRVSYGAALAAYAHDPAAPLTLHRLYSRRQTWHQSFLGRLQLMRFTPLPLVLLSAFILLSLWATPNMFAALKALLNVPGWIASAIATVFAAVPLLLLGKPVWVDAGVLGGVILLAVLFLASLVWFLWGAFQTGGYRFGYEHLPQKGALRPLLQKNLLLWLPTFILLIALAAVSYQELVLLAANLLSMEPAFGFKLGWLPSALLLATVISYLLLLPLRRYHTARWAADKG